MMIKLLKFVGVPTRDQDRALTFWTEKVGFKVATDQPMGAQRWIELSIPGADTGVVLFTPEGQEDRVGTFFNGSFGCDDVEYTYAKMSEKGVTFEGPPEKQPWGTLAKFKDPDGNTFVLSSRYLTGRARKSTAGSGRTDGCGLPIGGPHRSRT